MSKIEIVSVLGLIILVGAVIGGGWYLNASHGLYGATGALLGSVESSQKLITGFDLPGIDVDGKEVIDNVNHTVLVIVPIGTNTTKLTPVISVSDFAAISPGSGTPRDFTGPVTYTVTAQDGSTQKYVVTVEIAAAPDKD